MPNTKTPRTGRPPIAVPQDAAKRISNLAADGFSVRGVARGMDVSYETLQRWLNESPALKEAFEAGRETERQILHNVLYRQATEKSNIVAAMFLLKARHGYREGDQGETANRVSINFTLPGAMRPEQFTIENHDSTSNPVKQLSGKNLTRS